ncbi:aminotransferase class I/II-fold pyridoxal phosphate-dependent enzyme [Benzoatithermus flavus]|uniref:Aminotransferase class I/II-fold pyridoxal phosphate-dependent enzyme n=1 Tax=Benzoatithermus flavus TaxID=3108223 RepID=A0ABU8XWW1_9PROT
MRPDDIDIFDPGTILAHDEDLPGDAVVPPIFQTSLFTFPSYAAAVAAFRGEAKRSVYSRVGNPTSAAFEAKLAALEGAEAARGFASGMAAISAAVLSQVAAGDRILCVRHVYPDAYRFFETTLRRFGVRTDYVDGRDLAAIERALPGVRLLYLESPTSWMFEVQDLAAIARLARAHGVVTVIDNSWASPIFQRPLRHGIDLVVHSASKYLSGHSDTVAGVVAGRRELIGRINAEVLPFLGAKLAPFEAWLLLRGLRTLEIRMKAAQARGLAVARWLEQRPEVLRVHHPALAGAVDGVQLTGASSLFSFELVQGLSVQRFVDALRLFKLGVSWGGHESLVFPAEITHQQAGGPNSARDFGVSPRTIRLHVGLESTKDLLADLEAALAAATDGR